MVSSSASAERAESRGWQSGLRRGAWWVAATVITVALLYFAAALAGALIPRNAGWQEPEQGITFYIWDNGVHVDLVLPARAAGINLHEITPPKHMQGEIASPQWVALGWGQREFYLETPTWGDLTPRNALRAVTGGDSLMRISHREQRPGGGGVREIRVDPEGYRRMVAFASASFDRRQDGQPILLESEAHQPNDAFYEAMGGYNAFRTSNQWTADALAEAGIRVGVWTPLSMGVTWRYRRPGND